MLRPNAPALLSLAAALTLAAGAQATEVPLAGKPLLVDVTNTSVLSYHFDNRNTITAQPSTQVDDYYGEWIDRLNLQLSWWRLRFGVRVDTATYFNRMTRVQAKAKATQDVGQEPNVAASQLATDTNDLTNNFFRELHTRYLDTYYPSKLYLGYGQPGLDVTVGDFYAQLGRGLVFSVRKIDELAIDTTVRGAKAVFDHDFGGFRVGATALAGQMNPLRVDETSGRRLNSLSSPLFFGFPQGGNLTTYQYDGAGNPQPTTALYQPSYLEDTVGGGHLEVGTNDVLLSGNVAEVLRRSFEAQNVACTNAASGSAASQACFANFPDPSHGTNDPTRRHDTIRNFSGAINVPSILKRGDLYLEVAGQQLRDGHITAVGPDGAATKRDADLDGYAVYASTAFHADHFNLSFEGKHYRSFFPVAANVDTTDKAFGAPEFGVVSYSQPPTVEPVYTEPISGGAPNICITGGWLNADARVNPASKIFGWVGRYASWSDLDAVTCSMNVTPIPGGPALSRQTNTWDAAVGTELFFENRRSKARVWVGGRTTDCEDANCDRGSGPGTTYLGNTFYREGYVRYDLVKHLAGPLSIQLQGLHRHRYEPLSFPAAAWNEGENYTALQWSPHLSAIFGYEYTGQPGCQPNANVSLCHYFNGGVQWRSITSGRALEKVLDTVNVFVGQRRGALRCVSGVCRVFPPFEGAKLEVVSRF